MKRILKTIWGIYGLIIFVTTLMLVIIAFFIVFTFVPKKQAPFVAHRFISRTWAASLFVLFGIRLKVKNRDFLKKEQTYVFVANHLSQLDIPAYAVAAKHALKFLAKEELTKIPLMGYIIRNLYISVNRKDKFARAKSMENMISAIRDGISVFICPEGTRNKTNQPLLEFRDGAFRLAIQAQVPIATLTLVNSGKLLSPLHPLELSPGTLTCIWSEPISTIGMTEEDIPALKQKVINEMLRNLNG